MFDVLHVLADKRRVALEVTTEGDFDSIKTRRAIDKRTARGEFAGEGLTHQWHVSIDTSTRVATLQPAAIEATLRDFEARGVVVASSRGAHPRFGDPDARALAMLGLQDVSLWNPDPEPGAPRILVMGSWSVIGTHTALPEALARVLARTDNQDKLARADVDARHLYLHLRDRAACAGLGGVWALPLCPADPRKVIDAIWIYAPLASSAHLHRVMPGTDDWSHFALDTGEPVPESALAGS